MQVARRVAVLLAPLAVWIALVVLHTEPRVERVLAPHARRSHAARVTLVRVWSVLRVATAFFMAMLWAQRRSEPYYGWLALFLLTWALADLNHLVVEIPVPSRADRFRYARDAHCSFQAQETPPVSLRAKLFRE